jgi:hypothetical protein
MKVKTILVLLFFLVAIACLISPVNAKLDSSLEVDSSTTINGQTKLILYVDSDIGVKKKNTNSSTYLNSVNYISKRKAELNNVNKIVVTVNGYKGQTFKKPAKGWNIENLYFTKTFSIKGDQKKISDNYCSIKLYNNKNKLLKNKKSKVLFARWEPATGISSDPKKYFESMKKKNMKKKKFGFVPFYKFNTFSFHNSPKWAPKKNSILTTSSSNYFDKNSKFSVLSTKEYAYFSSYFWFPTNKMEKSKTYTNGKYKLTISTFTSGKTKYKQFLLSKNVYETRYNKVNNPYFAISKQCNWSNPSIKNLAEMIKANVLVSNYANNDLYKTALATEVLRYINTNIKYDNDASGSFDDNVKYQTATLALQKGKANCAGNSMLAGALLRYLDIPTYFQRVGKPEVKDDIGHIYIVSYIFYEGLYQWIPAESTYYFTSNYEYYEDYTSPFRPDAINWYLNKPGITEYSYPGFRIYNDFDLYRLT